MKILSIGMDRGLFLHDSAVRERTLAYGKLVDELHIIVFSNKTHNLKSERIAKNIQLHPTNSRNRFFYIFDAFFIGLSLLKKIRGKNMLITTQDSSETGIVGCALSSVKSIPLHVQIHTDIFSPFYFQESILNKVRVVLARITLLKASRIRVVSERIKKSILSKYGKKYKERIDVLPIFVDVSDFKNENNKNENNKDENTETFGGSTVLIVARLEREKNVAFALHAFSDVLPDYPNTRLTIVGEGSLRKVLEQLATNLHISKSIEFVGRSEKVAKYYNSADVYLQTSNYEGYGMALIEASISKCPIVTTDVGLVGEILLDEKSALVCGVGNRACLSQKIRSLLGDKEKAKYIAEEAFRAVHTVNIENRSLYMKQYLESWEKTL